MNLSKCDLQLSVAATLGNTLSDNVVVNDALSYTVKNSYTDGTGSKKAQLLFHTQRGLGSAYTETLDMRSLAGTVGSTFGTYTFTKIKAILITLETTTSTYRIEVGGAAANQFIGPLKDVSDIAQIGAGGRWFQESPVDGWATSSTCKDLKINNPSGGSITYRLIIIGEGTVA